MMLNLVTIIQANLKRRKNPVLVVTFPKRRNKHGKRFIARVVLNNIFLTQR